MLTRVSQAATISAPIITGRARPAISQTEQRGGQDHHFLGEEPRGADRRRRPQHAPKGERHTAKQPHGGRVSQPTQPRDEDGSRQRGQHLPHPTLVGRLTLQRDDGHQDHRRHRGKRRVDPSAGADDVMVVVGEPAEIDVAFEKRLRHVDEVAVGLTGHRGRGEIDRKDDHKYRGGLHRRAAGGFRAPAIPTVPRAHPTRSQ